MDIIQMLSYGLVAYTAYRAYRVVEGTLPGTMDAQIMGFVALLGLDFALLGWKHAALNTARGKQQREIARFMVWVQLFGVGLTTVADTVITFYGRDNAQLGQLQTIVVWAIPVILVANVVAMFQYSLADPAKQQQQAEHEFEDEIARQAAEIARGRKAQTASLVAPQLMAARMAEIIAAQTGQVVNVTPDDMTALLAEQRKTPGRGEQFANWLANMASAGLTSGSNGLREMLQGMGKPTATDTTGQNAAPAQAPAPAGLDASEIVALKALLLQAQQNALNPAPAPVVPGTNGHGTNGNNTGKA